MTGLADLYAGGLDVSGWLLGLSRKVVWWYVLRMITQEQAETRDGQDLLTGWPCALAEVLGPTVVDLDLGR